MSNANTTMEKTNEGIEKLKKHFPEINIKELLKTNLAEEFRKDIENLPDDYR